MLSVNVAVELVGTDAVKAILGVSMIFAGVLLLAYEKTMENKYRINVENVSFEPAN